MLLLSSQDNMFVVLAAQDQDQVRAEQAQMCVCLCNVYTMQTHKLDPFLGQLSVQKLSFYCYEFLHDFQYVMEPSNAQLNWKWVQSSS